MIDAALHILRGDYITIAEHINVIGEVSEKIDASHKANAAKLQSQIDDLRKRLADANARAEHLQAAVENLRGDLSVSNGSRDRAHIKISAAIKALQS